MKKIIILLLVFTFLCVSLWACSGKTGSGKGNSGTGQSSEIQQNNSKGGNANGNSVDNTQKSGTLRLLCDPDSESACNTEKGYYYLTGDVEKLRDENYGTHLMYMDFAAGREIYLCSTAGCKHDSADCPAVSLYDDFPVSTTRLFVLGDYLYILSREYDHDGTMSQGMVTMGEVSMTGDTPAALYRAKLDGTERKKIYTFDAQLTLEDIVIGNEQGIYVITKKLSADKTGNETYTTSSERKLVFLDLEDLSLKEVCDMTFQDHISWKVIGCCQNHFILSGTDFGRELSREENWNDDVYRELYQNSSQVYALLEPDSGKPKEICRQSNRYESSVTILGDSLYLSSTENQNIEMLDIGTGERKTLCSLPQNLIFDGFDDTLCCRDWDLAGNPSWYFVNTKTGEITRSPLVNQCTGWAIEFRGETSSDVLFVYDYDATRSSDDSYEIHQYQYALISKDDLFSGREAYRKIEMIGPGQ